MKLRVHLANGVGKGKVSGLGIGGNAWWRGVFGQNFPMHGLRSAAPHPLDTASIPDTVTWATKGHARWTHSENLSRFAGARMIGF